MPNDRRIPRELTNEEEALVQAAIANDPDNPEWTEEDFANTRPASEVLPPALHVRMREWCDQAGFPQCSAHGLRKAGAADMAETSATAHEIGAVTGHSNGKSSNATRDRRRARGLRTTHQRNATASHPSVSHSRR